MNTMEYLYNYRAKVVSVYNGDTIRVESSDLGFGLLWKKMNLRLYGIDTPELRGEEREEGIKVRDIVREKIQDQYVTIKTLKDKSGKYGRCLAIVILDDGTNLNDWLVENGYAKKYII